MLIKLLTSYLNKKGYIVLKHNQPLVTLEYLYIRPLNDKGIITINDTNNKNLTLVKIRDCTFDTRNKKEHV